MNTTILSIDALEILDSRGNPTLEVEVLLQDGSRGVAGVPSGASTGVHEAHELRDGDFTRYGGFGVRRALLNVRGEIAEALVGRNALDQSENDRLMIDLDGTHGKSRLGANALVGVSLALARSAAAALQLPFFQYLGGTSANRLPCPMLNVLNGGVHARGQGADVQEFMICPVGAPTYSEGLRWASEVYHRLGTGLQARGFPLGVGDEGGFAPPLRTNVEALDLIVEAIVAAGYQPGRDLHLAIDPASATFQNPQTGLYHLRAEGRDLTSEELVNLYSTWVDGYPLILIEDGLGEDDWEGWRRMTQRLGARIELVGDDLFVTNRERLRRGIVEKSANAVLVKPNQVGTLSETLDTVRTARQAGWGTMISHRSGETLDPFVAEFAVGINAGHFKAGAPCRGERLAKYNQLLRIEHLLGKNADYAGRTGFVR